MKLIVGLGNPGKEYEKTRHNSGFMAMDVLAEKLGVRVASEKWNAMVANVMIEGQKIVLMKPLTYMNESGSAVSQAVSFYHIEPSDILVMHDDMDLPTGSVRIRKNGSAGGQKGMKSIIECLSTSEIARIRIGVGHSTRGDHEKVPDWVLSPVPKAEQDEWQAALKDAAEAAYAWVYQPMDKVMNEYNVKVK
ncbi:MAG: aminoacyl-tRNA hydrolase [Solobacterium sp.]|jgi:PTH1 family peptidyl-tRNA hydrolase|nr:aminoacyl-tRNA hydrolase [Solobacterium sp.]MCH4205402.1 aminoacyl-tRNA hydrolase [Solobacterium sp.]MCH4226614.1 aminoacyl-tRNA hydrolase [Solobacterium sp.]MCH4282089.1 aminoacyl-tRNA hydrolase [Solobacterium sp.]